VAKKPLQQLEPPPIATSNNDAIEVMRVWTAPGEAQFVTLRPTWDDCGAWGLMLVDIARHAANAYANEGHNRGEVLQRIKQFFDAEWEEPTDTARQTS
jgi:hypothetical protein